MKLLFRNGAQIVFGLVFSATALMPATVLAAIDSDPLPTQFSAPAPTKDTYFDFRGVNNTEASQYKLPGVAKQDPRAIISNLISVISGFLGIIAVVIILMSGFQWMTAGGDEEAIKKAQQRLIQGIIGLILILSTWSIAFYVVNTVSLKIFGAN